MGSRVRLIVFAELLAALVAVVTNVATSVLPDSWQPYLWLAWPILGALIITGIVLSVFAHRADTRPVTADRAAYSRRAMLAQLRTVWIEGVLDRSLYRRTIVELGLTERPDLLERTWDIVVDVPDEKPRPLDRATALVDVLERHRGLLLLGAPGAGKTTMLLTFLEDLLAQAASDDIAPIPVVFQLASWPSSGKPMAEWFIDELSGPLYGVPSDLARSWIADDRVLPLLDGLDEVALSHRLACARAIDTFHRSHRLLPLIVTSRVADYDALSLRLSLGTALLLQPLTRKQTEEYLDRLGEPLAGLREALRREPSLWELLRTPFLLNVAVRAYHGLPASDVSTEGQENLIAAFVDRALRRRNTGLRIAAPEAVRALAFIARALGQNLNTSFRLGVIDANWLPPRLFPVVSVVTTVPFALLAGGATELLMALFFGTPIGLAAGALAAAGAAATSRRSRLPNRRSSYTTNPVVNLIADIGLTVRLAAELVIGLGVALGLGGAAVGTVVGSVRVIAGSGSFLSSFVPYVLVGTVAGALLGFGATVIFWTPDAKPIPLFGSRPTATLSDTVWLCAGYAAAFGIPATGALWACYGPVGALAGLLVALTVGYAAGGDGLVAHWLTRVLMARVGILPLRLTRFLDLAVDRMLMLPVDGGHAFVHRLLLEHFAGLEPSNAGESYPPAVDLRPHVLLDRALVDVRDRPENTVALLSYTAGVLPSEVWVPKAMRIADALAEPRKAHPESAYTLGRVLHMIIVAEHAELSPVAAIRFGKLFLRAPRSFHPGDKRDVMALLDTVMASENSAMAAEAAATLALLKEKWHTQALARPGASPE